MHGQEKPQQDGTKKNPDYQRNWKLKSYGLTSETFADLLTLQGNRCAICHKPEPQGRHNQWHIDHDHETGVVRGLLCSDCNVGIGHFHDDIEHLASAINYLSDPPAKKVLK